MVHVLLEHSDARRDNVLKRAVWALTVVGLVVIALVSSLVTLPEEASAYTIHDPIVIDGNGDFTAANGVTGGSGTPMDPFVIEGWEISPPPFGIGIKIQNTNAHFIIRDVYVHSGDIDMSAISMNNVTDSNITKSTLFGFGNSIGFSWSTNITIADNEISGAWIFAISGGPSFNVTLTGNNISGRMGNVYLANTDNILISDNYIRNGWNSVSFFNSSFVTFTNNTVADATTMSIFLGGTTNALVHHNNFVTDWATYQAIDDFGPLNAWDDGYPSGGNYWSDYTGTDVMSGPNQDIPGSDGIGDTPYIIDLGTQDNYPLMTPATAPGVQPPMWPKARLGGLDVENVTISWDLSSDDGGSFKTVVGYRVYRNVTYDPDGLGYQLIGTVPNGTSEFTDTSAGEGNPNTYFYLVCAFDVGNNASCAEQVVKYTRPLAKGMNLVSIPICPTDSSVEGVFQTVSFDQAWTRVWNASTSTSEWKFYSTEKPYREEFYICGRGGIWINVIEDSNLTVAGNLVWPEIRLKPGWNLVAFPSFSTTYTVADFKGATSLVEVEGFDPTTPPYHLRALGDGEVFQTGHGYWILSDSHISWLIPPF
jgi:hypothetical protein